MANPSPPERQQTEISLLLAMYPTQIEYNPQSNEVKYTRSTSGTLILRLPTTYPEHDLPELIMAVDGRKREIRTRTKHAIDALNLDADVEVLDAIIQGFEELCVSLEQEERDTDEAEVVEKRATTPESKTMVIWLHHLLNPNKRKLALSPTVAVSGITKPGYPGILVYSGPRDEVDVHVAELRAQRWQAFQVRFEAEGREWVFTRGKGVWEVERMADVVQGLVGEEDREVFLRVVGVK